MFKLINKELSLYKAGLISFGLILFAYFPLINDRIYFVDDTTRSIKGYFGWTELGRPLTEWLYMMMTLNSKLLADITPLPQLLSIFILCITVIIIIRNTFSYPSIAAVLISMTAVINPLVMGNMLYRYDSLSMVISLLLPVLAWEKINQSKYVYSGILLICCLCLYQPAIAIFPLLVMYTFLKNVSNEQWTPKSIFISALVTISSCLAYFFCVVKLTVESTESRGELSGFGKDLIKNTFYGIKNAADTLYYSYGKIGGAILFCLSLIFLFCYLNILLKSIGNKSISHKAIRVFFISLSPIAILLCTVGVNLILSNGYYPLRVLFPIAFIIFIIFSLASELNILVRNISTILAACLIFVAISISFVTASSLYQQNRYDSFVLFSVSQYLMTHSEYKNIYIYGSTLNSLSSKTAAKAYPVINYVRNNYYDMTFSQALVNNGIGNIKFSSQTRSISANLAKKACAGALKINLSTPQYNIYSSENDLLIYLGNADCK